MEVILDHFDEIPESDDVVIPQGERIIVEDEFFKLTARRLEIKNYFFPSKKSRFINISEIKCIYYKNQKKGDVLLARAWGMHGTKVWWALDTKRPVRGLRQTLYYNIVVDCGERTMKGFTVTSLDKFCKGIEQVAPQIAYIRDKLPDIF